jgi:hypothetical protein
LPWTKRCWVIESQTVNAGESNLRRDTRYLQCSLAISTQLALYIIISLCARCDMRRETHIFLKRAPDGAGKHPPGSLGQQRLGVLIRVDLGVSQLGNPLSSFVDAETGTSGRNKNLPWIERLAIFIVKTLAFNTSMPLQLLYKAYDVWVHGVEAPLPSVNTSPSSPRELRNNKRSSVGGERKSTMSRLLSSCQ